MKGINILNIVDDLTRSIKIHLHDTERDRKLGIINELAMSLLHKPGVWGKQDPIDGFDCSGFIVYLLRSVGLIEQSADYSSWALAERYPVRVSPEMGALAFYGTGTVTHVMYCLNDLMCIGAVGCKPSIKTIEDAVASKASVKIKNVYYRTDLLYLTQPFSYIENEV